MLSCAWNKVSAQITSAAILQMLSKGPSTSALQCTYHLWLEGELSIPQTLSAGLTMDLELCANCLYFPGRVYYPADLLQLITSRENNLSLGGWAWRKQSHPARGQPRGEALSSSPWNRERLED